MNNGSFIKGLLFGLSFAQSLIPSPQKYFNQPRHIVLGFDDGSEFIFAINRGIAPSCGVYAIMLTQELGTALFDVVQGWLTPRTTGESKEVGIPI